MRASGKAPHSGPKHARHLFAIPVEKERQEDGNENLEQALAGYREAKLSSGVAEALLSLGDLLGDFSEYDSALTSYGEARAAYQQAVDLVERTREIP